VTSSLTNNCTQIGDVIKNKDQHQSVTSLLTTDFYARSVTSNRGDHKVQDAVVRVEVQCHVQQRLCYPAQPASPTPTTATFSSPKRPSSTPHTRQDDLRPAAGDETARHGARDGDGAEEEKKEL